MALGMTPLRCGYGPWPPGLASPAPRPALEPPSPSVRTESPHCARCGVNSAPWRLPSPRDPLEPLRPVFGRSLPTARAAAATQHPTEIRAVGTRCTAPDAQFGSGPGRTSGCAARAPCQSFEGIRPLLAGAGVIPRSSWPDPEVLAAAAGECACCPPDGDDGVQLPGAAAHSPTHEVEWRGVSSYSRLSGTVRWLWNSRPGNAGLAAPRPGTIPGSPAVTVPSLSGPPTGTRGHGKPHGTQNDPSASRCSKYPEVTGRTKAALGGSG